MYFVALCCNGKTKNLVVRTRRVFKGFAFLLLQIELFNEIGKTKFKLKKIVKAVLLSCSVHNINASTVDTFFLRGMNEETLLAATYFYSCPHCVSVSCYFPPQFSWFSLSDHHR